MNTTTEPLTRSQKKQRDIIQAAERIFSECGYRGASMDQIAERAQVSKRTIYNHFSSKEVLFRHITDLLIEDVEHSSTVTYQSDQPLDKQLLDILSGAWDALTSPRMIELVRVILTEYMQNPEMAQVTMERINKSEDGLKSWLKAAIADKRLQAIDVEFAVTVLRGALHEFAQHPMLFFSLPAPSQKEKQYALKEITSMFLGRYQSSQ